MSIGGAVRSRWSKLFIHICSLAYLIWGSSFIHYFKKIHSTKFFVIEKTIITETATQYLNKYCIGILLSHLIRTTFIKNLYHDTGMLLEFVFEQPSQNVYTKHIVRISVSASFYIFMNTLEHRIHLLAVLSGFLLKDILLLTIWHKGSDLPFFSNSQ